MAEEKLTTRAQDFSAWYNEIVERAQLAEHSPVRGCMVIRPNGYGIWELIQQNLDKMFKDTGHENAYFPLLIPQSFMSKEAEHVEGFAPELAVVTHGGGKELEEPLVIRPTSETMIYTMFAKWVQGYRDLPILMNQWANVVRWEMRTRLFLRTTEFLWQEGHTAHETEADAEEETLKMLGVYGELFAEEFMATPVITGLKTDSERFAGALRTYCIEAMMQDNKALQAGTSHNLGQNFSKAFDLKFQGRDGSVQYAWNTSWGVSTRLIGSIIMTHSDDDGLVLPPKLAPTVAVIVPIFKTDEEKSTVLDSANAIYKDLRSKGFRVKIDMRDNMSPGAKYYEWELKGVPLRIEIGPKDVANKTVVIVPRIALDSQEAHKPGRKQKLFVGVDALCDKIEELSVELQAQLLKNARTRREANTIRGVKSYDEMKEIFSKGEGAFVYAGWNGDPAIEAKVKEETKATIRCIPDAEFRSETAPEKCISGEKAKHEVIWAKAY